MIYCVEDDASIRDIEVYALTSVGLAARGFEDGDSFWQAVKSAKEIKPELILLDVMLPGIDGIELLRRLKESAELCDIPVILATAKGTEFDKVQSRVKAVLRRCKPKNEQKLLTAGGLCLNQEERIVTADGARVSLTFKEYELLRLFLSHPGTVFTRDQLYREIWGDDYIGESRTVDMHIRTLRVKLGGYGDRIETVRQVGYRFAPEA